jgi:hypothetical protein
MKMFKPCYPTSEFWNFNSGQFNLRH